MKPEVIILAGGKGTRLQQVISDVPKPMAPVAGKPFLTYLLDQMVQWGIEKAKLSVGYKHEIIESYFGKRYKSLELDYVVEEVALGTGGGIRLAAERCASNDVLVLNGDTFFDVDINQLLGQHGKTQSGMTIALKQMEKVTRYGMVKRNENRIVGFEEKSQTPQSGWINGGIYCLNREVFLNLTQPGVFSMETEFMEKRVNEVQMMGFESNGYFIDIGIPEDYKIANTYFENY